MRVIVDDKKCCGSGQCVRLAPQVFDQGDDGLVRLLVATPPPALHAAVRDAAAACPCAVITIDERG